MYNGWAGFTFARKLTDMVVLYDCRLPELLDHSAIGTQQRAPYPPITGDCSVTTLDGVAIPALFRFLHCHLDVLWSGLAENVLLDVDRGDHWGHAFIRRFAVANRVLGFLFQLECCNRRLHVYAFRRLLILGCENVLCVPSPCAMMT